MAAGSPTSSCTQMHRADFLAVDPGRELRHVPRHRVLDCGFCSLRQRSGCSRAGSGRLGWVVRCGWQEIWRHGSLGLSPVDDRVHRLRMAGRLGRWEGTRIASLTCTAWSLAWRTVHIAPLDEGLITLRLGLPFPTSNEATLIQLLSPKPSANVISRLQRCLATRGSLSLPSLRCCKTHTPS